MLFFAISAAGAGFDWLFPTLYLTWCPRIPPVALTCLKNAVAPQLSVSPICAYTPDSARSPQMTIGDFADWPDDDEPPHAASSRLSPARMTRREESRSLRFRLLFLSLRCMVDLPHIRPSPRASMASP